jgi:plastocyanin
MTRAFKILSFQVAALASAGVMMTTVATMTHAAAPAAAAVQIDNFSFKAPTLTVKPGTTVTWTNQDDIPHSIVLTAIGVRSKPMDTDGSFAYRFDKAGTFSYICGLHPQMHGQVVVK